MVAEVRSLKTTVRQRQKPTSRREAAQLEENLPGGSKKRASSNPDQDGSRKRRKAPQLEENLPEFAEFGANSQVDTDLIEDLPPTDTDRQSRFMGRSRDVMAMRWSASKRDSGSHSDGEGGDSGGSDDDEDKGKDGDKDKEDKEEDEEDKDGDEEDENKEEEEEQDEEDEPLCDSEIPGISVWDLLGEDFEREAAALGLDSSYELPTQLTTLQMKSVLENRTLSYFLDTHLKWRTTCQIVPSVDLPRLFQTRDWTA